MNNKAIIEFGFRIIWRIMEIEEGVIRLGLRLRRITPSSISIINNYWIQAEYLLKNYEDRRGCYPSSPLAEADNTFPDLHNSWYDSKAEFSNFLLLIQNNS